MIPEIELKKAYKLFELTDVDLRPISINKLIDLPSSKYRNAHDKLFVMSNMNLSLSDCVYKYYSNNISSPHLQWILEQRPPDLYNIKFSKETLQKIKTFNNFYLKYIENTNQLHLFSVCLYLYNLNKPINIKKILTKQYSFYSFEQFIKDTKYMFHYQNSVST